MSDFIENFTQTLSDSKQDSVEPFAQCQWKKLPFDKWCLADSQSSNCYSNSDCKAKGCGDIDCMIHNSQ